MSEVIALKILRFPDIKKMYEINRRFSQGERPTKEEFDHMKQFEGVDKTGTLIEIIEQAAEILERANTTIFLLQGDEQDFSYDPELCQKIRQWKGRWGIKGEPTKTIQS